MSISTRVQLLLGFSAAFAAYLLLAVYSGGRVDLGDLNPFPHNKASSVASQPTPGTPRKP